MPKLNKIFTLDVTPEQFLEACSRTELIELQMLLQSQRFINKMVELTEKEEQQYFVFEGSLQKYETAALGDKNSLAGLFSDYFMEDQFNLLDTINDIVIINKGIIELKLNDSGDFLLFDVALSEERENIEKLVPDIKAYTLECKKRYAHSDDDNVFNFSLAVEFYAKFFDGTIEYSKESGFFYIRKKTNDQILKDLWENNGQKKLK